MRRTASSCWASFSPNTATSGARQVQQLEDDGEHAVEVPGPGRALEDRRRCARR